MSSGKHNGLRWRFINQTNTQEVVIVHDILSAQNLAQLLQKMGGDWVMQEERPLSALMPEVQSTAPDMPTPAVFAPTIEAAAPAPAPVVEQAPQAPVAPVVEAVTHTPAPTLETAPVVQVSEPVTEPEQVIEQNFEETAEETAWEAPAVVEAPVIEAVAPVQPAPVPVAEERRASVPVPPPAPKKVQKRERRTQPRFMTEFRVILISGSSSFRTMSLDVSLGGMRLKKTIPENFMREKCVAYVSHKDLSENIEIVCNVVGDPQDPCRIQFVQPNPTQIKRLSDWLIEHNQPLLNRKVAS